MTADSAKQRKYRHQVIRLVRALDQDAMLGVEVGAGVGVTSAMLLDEFPALRLYMIDAWAGFEPDSEYARSGDKRAKLTHAEHENRMVLARQAVAHAADRAVLIRSKSHDAAATFGTVADFVFIDASHAFGDVKRDLISWYDNLRAGGLLCGHDYSDREGWGVKAAVNWFFQRHGLELSVDPGTAIWWGYKP